MQLLNEPILPFLTNKKPLGGTNYGSIPHLPKSRLGSRDHSCHIGQSDICTVKTRDNHDLIIVQEKLDGSNVGIAKVNGQILALTRAGYEAKTSLYKQHHEFQQWVDSQHDRFHDVLQDGERIVGEWLVQANGTKYKMPHEPFVAFDIMQGKERVIYAELESRLRGKFVLPHLVHKGCAISVEAALVRLGVYGAHGALDPVEGLIYRVERCEKVDFLAKFVRQTKNDRRYLGSVTDRERVFNEWLA